MQEVPSLRYAALLRFPLFVPGGLFVVLLLQPASKFVDPFIPFPFPSFCLANHFNYFLRNGFWTTCTPFTGSSIQCSTSTLDRASECGEARGRPVSLLETSYSPENLTNF